MKKTLLPLLSLLLAACGSQEKVRTYSITDFGAVPETICTQAIQAAIDKASGAGGGQVLVPEGVFLSATLYLKDNVDLHLAQGAVLQGVDDPDAYSPYIPEHDLTRYDSGNGTANSNCVNDRQWMKAFLIGAGVENASITGPGTIDGVHVFDERGEENMRGPHTIIVAEAKGFRMEDVHISRAANYAFLGYALEAPLFQNVFITEGWDGIHIRGCRDGVIRGCKFQTGDDSIAGGYWDNMLIEDCDINSSCNGIRMIMPSDGLEVRNCQLHPHQRRGPAQQHALWRGTGARCLGEGRRHRPQHLSARPSHVGPLLPRGLFRTGRFRGRRSHHGEHIGHGAYRRPHARCVLERFGLPKDYSPELLI